MTLVYELDLAILKMYLLIMLRLQLQPLRLLHQLPAVNTSSILSAILSWNCQPEKGRGLSYGRENQKVDDYTKLHPRADVDRL